MSARADGGPAFPSHGSMGEVTHEGMSLCDYFAGRALQAMVGAAEGQSFGLMGEGHINCDRFSLVAYALADAMLRARRTEAA